MPTRINEIELLHEAFIGLLISRNQSVKIEEDEDCVILRALSSGILFIEDGVTERNSSLYRTIHNRDYSMDYSPFSVDGWGDATGREITWSSYVHPNLAPRFPEHKWARFIATCRYDEDEQFEAFKKDIELQGYANCMILKRGQIFILPDMEIVGFKNGLELLFKIKDVEAAKKRTQEQEDVRSPALLCRKNYKWRQNISKTSMSRS